MPEPEDNSIVNIKMELTKEDVVSIKVADFEDKLMAFETQVQEDIAKANESIADLTKDANKLLKGVAEAAYTKKLAALLESVATMEEVDPKDLTGTISVDENDRYTRNHWGGHNDIQDPEKHKRFSVAINISQRKGGDNHGLFNTYKTMDKPKEWFKVSDEIKAIRKHIDELTVQLQKSRETIQKMPSVERHCRAELAKAQLKKAKREDILEALDRVVIPGLPTSMQRVLAAPAAPEKKGKKGK